jgi:hypothetical protein
MQVGAMLVEVWMTQAAKPRGRAEFERGSQDEPDLSRGR